MVKATRKGIRRRSPLLSSLHSATASLESHVVRGRVYEVVIIIITRDREPREVMMHFNDVIPLRRGGRADRHLVFVLLVWLSWWQLSSSPVM